MNIIKLTTFLFILILFSSLSAQTLSGSGSILFEFHKISDIRNGYTIQSNGSPQQLWIDLNNPGYLHAVFINSQSKSPPYADRNCIYFGSIDNGVTWFQPGPVPDTSRSGFPAIGGTADGSAIIVNHSDYFGLPTRTGLFIDESPFHYNFAAYDPGTQIPTLWPRCYRILDEKVLIVATAQKTGGNIAFNTFDMLSSTFSGWTLGPVTGPEMYSLSISDGGKIGFAYISDDTTDAGDVFYFESTNGGITWSTPLKIFDCPAEQGIAVGALRGISLNFYVEQPCIVFETCQQDFSQFGGVYFPRIPNQILFWSPNVNGGSPKVIADSSNVPFAPSINPSDVFPPLARPVIGRSELYEILIVAFSTSTENVYLGTDSVTYFAGYFTYTTDGGSIWAEPQKFTPDEPLLDWKYISTPAIHPVYLAENSEYYLDINYVLQADSLEESPDPNFLSAQYYHCSYDPLIPDIWPSVDDKENLISFNLRQNYPNPFNPNTTIKYSIPSRSFVQLKIFDVLGNEIATLVNEEKVSGSYAVNFNASNLPSGAYFYSLNAGNFTQTKKMILMK